MSRHGASRPVRAALRAATFICAGAALSWSADAGAPPVREEVTIVRTAHGEIVWRFFPAEAPGHTAYVKELIRNGFYNGTKFHRVIPHFVIQGGDPLSKNDDRADDGWGEADRKLKGEFSAALHYRPGTVGMARDADPDSGSCQFFIALESLPRLSGSYTIFAEVVEGLEVARKIASLPRDLEDNPLDDVVVSIELEERLISGGVLSREPGESGERVTGPGRRPRFLDPGNTLWSAPRKISGEDPTSPRARGRLEVTVDTDGSVIDVRFPAVPTLGASRLRDAALTWRFEPVLYDGQPQLVRFEMESDGTAVGPSTGGGAPVEAGGGEVAAPLPAVRVDLEPGSSAPATPTRLRLTIDGAGAVTEASVRTSCGDAALDKASAEAASRMLFTPVEAGKNPDGSPRTRSVYLDVEARFVEADKP